MIFTNQKEKEDYQLKLARKSKILYWAETKLKWRPKFDEKTGKTANYQILLLGCAEEGLYRYPDDYPITDPKVNLRGKPIRKFAWRIGRQSFGPLTLIHTQDGKVMPISEHPDAFPTQKHAEIYNLHLQHGVNLKLTKEHPVAVLRDEKIQWVKAEEICLGEKIEILYEYDKWGDGIVKYSYLRNKEIISGNLQINNSMAELLGLLVTDGSVKSFVNKTRPSSLVFTNTNINYINRVENLVKEIFPDMNVLKYTIAENILINEKTRYVLMFTSKNKRTGGNQLFEFIRMMNVHPCGFPRAVAEYFTREQVCAFLNGAWQGDGNSKVSLNPCMTEFAANNEYVYAEYFKELFTKLGIFCRIRPCTSKKSKKLHYKLRFTSHRVLHKLRDTIGQVVDKEFPYEIGIKDDIKDIPIYHTYENGERTTLAKLKKVTVEKNREDCWDMEVPGRGWFFASSSRVHNSGKCLPQNTIIHTRDGKLLPIQEHPLAFPTRQNALIYHLETVSGYSIRATDNHPISTIRDGQPVWARMDTLQPGDEIECLYEWDKWGDGFAPYSYNILLAAGMSKNGRWEKREDISGIYQINDELAELLGWITSDGNFRPNHTNSINFRNTNVNYINRVEYLVNKNFPNVKTKIHKYEGKNSDKDNYFLYFYSGDSAGKSKNNNDLRKFLRAMDNHECGFPKAVAQYFTKSQVCAFFRGLYGGNGNIHIRPANCESTLACSLNRTYAEYCHSLLLKLGIVNKITVQTGKKATAPFYTVRFRNQTALIKFRDTVGQILDKPIPLGEKFSKRKIFSRYNKEPHFSGFDGEKFVWDKIRKITIEKDTQNCYDVTYPEKGWFVANGVKVHNSECMSVIALYLSICKPIKMTKWERYKDKDLISEENPTGWSKREINYYRGAKTIVASADATKVKLVFDRVMKLINESPEYSPMLEAGVIEQKLHPYPMLTFNAANWSEPAILSFRGPGANGQALRGSTFDYKLYDEVDYIPQSFFEAELATTINAGESALTILSSTPSGRREQFYYACFEGGTPILMEDGTFKSIEEVKVGDRVINRFGKAEPVTQVMSRPYTGWVSNFTTTLGSKITRATINHKFMAIRGDERYCHACLSIVWSNRSYCPVYGAHTGYPKLIPEYIEIGKLTLGDFLVIPKNYVKDKKLISFYHEDEKFVYVAIDSMKKSRIVRTQVYNLTVGEDHSYCVDYYGVANCTNSEWGYEEFHFPSWENPSYNATMDKEFREKLTTTAYEHEIMADWGTVEEGVFNWNYFHDVFNYDYTMRPPEQRKNNIGFDEYTLLKLDHLSMKQIGINNLGLWLQRKLPPRKELCRYYFGADLGYSSDPSEFIVFEQFNGVMKGIVRLHSANISYDVQADLIAAFDKHFMFDMLGMDQGNAGIAVEQMLKSDLFSGNGYNKYASHNFKDRLVAVQFGQKVSIGNVAGRDQIVPVKQWMTDLIIKQAEEKLLILPNIDYDPDIENQFRNHTYSIGANGTIIYSKSDMYPDHCVDAVRTAFYAKCTSTLPKKRAWPTGSTFKSRGNGGWR